MTGYNLPPGVNVSDIPGNRPEDGAWEKIMDEFWEKKLLKSEKRIIEQTPSSNVAEIISEAIEFGIELGKKEQQAIDVENKFYKEQAEGTK